MSAFFSLLAALLLPTIMTVGRDGEVDVLDPGQWHRRVVAPHIMDELEEADQLWVVATHSKHRDVL